MGPFRCNYQTLYPEISGRERPILYVNLNLYLQIDLRSKLKCLLVRAARPLLKGPEGPVNANSVAQNNYQKKVRGALM